MKHLLLASVSAFALVGTAHAADLAVAPPMAVPSWAGFYLGIDGGVTRHDGSFIDLNGLTGTEATYSTSKTGGIAGGYAGYNWQQRSFVYGVEADINWVGATAQETLGGETFFSTTYKQSQNISWLATFRARAGIDIESTLIYLTGGLAVAGVKDSFNGYCSIGIVNCLGLSVPFEGFSESKTQLGWTAGVGFEHMFDAHWTVRGEFRYVDLGRSALSCFGVSGSACTIPPNNYRGEFSNTLMTGLMGVGYKF
jgi:outer membrane immunogenic protein